MNPFFPRLVSYVSASVALTFHASGQPPMSGSQFVLTVFALFSVGVAVSDAIRTYKHRPKRFQPNSPEIERYLCSWLKAGGLSAVFSRDLSWAAGTDAYAILRRKARQGELLAFVGRETAEIKELASLGGEVRNYSDLGFAPMSRFTIVDYGKASPRVAIGLTEGGRHVIREFDSEDRALIALANDLIGLTRLIARRLA